MSQLTRKTVRSYTLIIKHIQYYNYIFFIYKIIIFKLYIVYNTLIIRDNSNSNT